MLALMSVIADCCCLFWVLIFLFLVSCPMNKLIFKFTVINHIHGGILLPVNATINHIYESFFCNWTFSLIQKVNVNLFFSGNLAKHLEKLSFGTLTTLMLPGKWNPWIPIKKVAIGIYLISSWGTIFDN